MTRFTFLAIVIAAVLSAGCVKIESNYADGEGFQPSEITADKHKMDWTARLQQATPLEKATLLVDYFDRVIASHVEFGRETIQMWRSNEKQRGAAIPDTVVQGWIDGWLKKQRPMVDAYEDNIKYAARQIRLSDEFDDTFLAALDQLIDHHADVRSSVFVVRGTVEDYEYRLEQAQFDTRGVVEDFRRRLKSF